MEPNCISAALGFRAHSGWAAAVAVAGAVDAPFVIERRRIVTADASIAGSKQPYHAAERMDLPQANAFIERCRSRSIALAADAITLLASDVGRKGYRLVVTGVLFGAGRVLPDLASILRSHPLLHTAEGVFYRAILIEAARRCGLAAHAIKEREIPPILLERAGELRRTLGPPWGQDEKLAALAGWMALSAAAPRLPHEL